MASIKEKLAHSLTADSTELIPYLPYLLQDLWELGSSPDDILELIQTHIAVTSDQPLRILDLACGKGAVSVHLARFLHCTVKGVDLLSDFIVTARQKASAAGVQAACTFVVADANESVNQERDYDIVVFGAAGDILGDPASTIHKLSRMIRAGGYLIIDDGYANQDDDPRYFSKKDWQTAAKANGMRMIAEKPVDEAVLAEINRLQQTQIARRVHELVEMHPQMSSLFIGYMQSQLAECQELENDIVGVTMLLKSESETSHSR